MKPFHILKIGVLSLAIAALMGCGSDASNSATNEPSSGGSTTSNSSGKKLTIGVSIPAADHGWTAGVKYWAEQEMKKYPDVEFVYQTAESPDKQIASLESMGAKQVDGLVILATESSPITPAAKRLKEQGVFIVNVDRGFTEPIADIFLAGDNKKFGRLSAEFMAKKLNGKGDILVLEGIPCTVNTDRVDAAKEVFAKFPGIKILDSQTGMWNQQKSFEVMQTLLVKHKKFDAVWAQDDDMALGVEKALKEAGITNVWILGGAGMKDIVKRVMDNDPMYPADVTYPPSMIAEGIKVAVETLTKTSADDLKKWQPKNIDVAIDLVEPANAKNFYFPDSIY